MRGVPPPPAPDAQAAARRLVVERVLADPPAVHPLAAGPGAPIGVWATDPDCYRYLADRCPPGTRTLETGCGASTVCFAALGTDHTCVTPGEEEVARIRAHCAARAISLDGVRFEVGSSHEVLPRLAGDLDLVLVDGGHGFPLPILDWFYAGARLVAGGILVVDDLPLPAVVTLVRFLERDPRWAVRARTAKWAAFERLQGGPLAEDWTSQPFHAEHPRGLAPQLRRVRGRLLRGLRRRG